MQILCCPENGLSRNRIVCVEEEGGMGIDELEIWKGDGRAAWARRAAERWAGLAERAARIYMGLFEASPLPRTETELLTLLWRDPASGEPSVLARQLRVSRQTMTGLLDKLEAGGYLSRGPHPTDRRRTVLRLGEAGREVVRRFAGTTLRREAALFEEAASEAEAAEELEHLERMVARIESWHLAHPLE